MSLSSTLDSPDNTLLVARHPIQVVASRTGLSIHVLRAWERRYGAIKPQRSDGNRRLYSDEDVERLSLLKRATTAGRRIGDVAHLSLQSLVDLVGTDDQPPEFLTISPRSASRRCETSRDRAGCPSPGSVADPSCRRCRNRWSRRSGHRR